MKYLFPIILHATTTICTFSVQLSPNTQFAYAPNVIVLDIPGYNTGTVKTGGLPDCGTVDVVIGYASKKPVGGFVLDDQNNETDL